MLIVIGLAQFELLFVISFGMIAQLSARTVCTLLRELSAPTDTPSVLEELRWGSERPMIHPHDEKVPTAATL